MQSTRLRIGVSSCLIGNNVRYNGGHLSDGFINNALEKYVEWVPVCPEVEAGMGVPREEVRLVGTAENPQMLGSRSKTDHTNQMLSWASGRVVALSQEHLDGFILTANSPSCGIFRVKVYSSKGSAPARNGMGFFARSLSSNYPDLPIEENGRLHDPRIRENFVERIFTRKRWNNAFSSAFNSHDLVEFHTSHKFAFMAHSVSLYREMGQLVAKAGLLSPVELKDTYTALMSSALKQMATPKKHANVMQHIMGFLKDFIDADDKKEITETIDRYRMEQVPLIVPITLLNHHLRKNSVSAWILNQTYLNPYPTELLLRHSV